jgi:2-polyprenyl-3-methyl-5-hydroxy-6-metoxy-1,4-benzoquinol methylase
MTIPEFRAPVGDPYSRIEKTGLFTVDDIDLIAQTYREVRDTPNTRWDHFRHKHLILPDWFDKNIDPLSDAYLAQQKRLWNVIAGVDRDYVPAVDEAEEPIADLDPIRYPGYYLWRHDAAVPAASNHMLATGMLMKHSGLKPGMWALEYGAGFAQTALALARMGVNVDTVDISATFCKYVKAQADFFGVNLTPHEGEFGHNPRGDQQYDLIWFYESFHHCLDFRNVVRTLKDHLTPSGRILMAGEPIIEREYEAIPYPWGLRLEAEVIAVIRNNHWFELGYTEDFITNFFVTNGYIAERFDCAVSLYGVTYSFTPGTDRIDLAKHWIPFREAETWHAAEPTGRWTRAKSSLAIDQSDSFRELVVTLSNHHGRAQTVRIEYGGQEVTVPLAARSKKTVRLDATHKSAKITFRCRPIVQPAWHWGPKDKRALGVFVHHIDYVR